MWNELSSPGNMPEHFRMHSWQVQKSYPQNFPRSSPSDMSSLIPNFTNRTSQRTSADMATLAVLKRKGHPKNPAKRKKFIRTSTISAGFLTRVVSGDGSYRAKTQKQLKWLKNDSKVTFRGQPESDSKMTQKWLFFQSKMTRKVTFESLLCHFRVTFSHFWVTLIIFEFWLCSCRPHSQDSCHREVENAFKTLQQSGVWIGLLLAMQLAMSIPGILVLRNLNTGLPWVRRMRVLGRSVSTIEVSALGEVFVLLTVGAFCLWSSFFAYSPLRCFLDTLSHCKQRFLEAQLQARGQL